MWIWDGATWVDATEHVEVFYPLSDYDTGEFTNSSVFLPTGFGNVCDFGRTAAASYEYYSSFLAFRNILIPKGSEILSAFVRICMATTATYANLYAKVALADSANASVPTSISGAFSAAKTSFSNFTVASVTTGVTLDLPDIKSQVQQIINKSDWVSGNPVVAYIMDNNSSQQNRTVFYNRSNGSLYPELHVKYKLPLG